MQNKPNFRKAKMSANAFSKKDYENTSDWILGQNKPNSNPIKPNFQKAQMNVNLTLTKDYIKKDDFSVRINKPNFRNGQNERKLNFNKGLQKKRLFSSPKNKPNQTQFTKGRNELKIACRKIRPHPREFGRRFIVAFILVSMVQFRIALQVYISHTITNRTEFFTRKG
jgi:hypothetical protein